MSVACWLNISNGWTSMLPPAGKGKVPYAVLALLDTLRHFPGQIPDLDAYIQTSDFPCIKQPELDEVQGRPAIPLFGYSSNVEHRDIPFPDYTYWGHEYSRLTGTLPLSTTPLNRCLCAGWLAG